MQVLQHPSIAVYLFVRVYAHIFEEKSMQENRTCNEESNPSARNGGIAVNRNFNKTESLNLQDATRVIDFLVAV